MKYAKQLHSALLPYYKDYKEKFDKLEDLKKPITHTKEGWKELSALEKEEEAVTREIARKKAEIACKEARAALDDAVHKMPDTMRQKFIEEIEGGFALDPAAVDDKVLTLINSPACKPFDMVTMYRTAKDNTNKRLIAAKLEEYLANNRRNMHRTDIEAAAVIVAESHHMNADACLKDFDAVVTAYSTFNRSGSILDALPRWAADCGLDMD